MDFLGKALRSVTVAGSSLAREGGASNRYCFFVDITTDNVHVYDKSSLAEVKQISTPAAVNTGFHAGVKYWWFMDFGTDIVYQCYSFTATPVQSWSSAGFTGAPAGLYVRGNSVYLAAFTAKTIYETTLQGALKRSFTLDAAVTNVFGISSDDKNMIIADNGLPGFHVVDWSGTTIVSYNTSAIDGTCTTAVKDGRYVWLTDAVNNIHQAY